MLTATLREDAPRRYLHHAFFVQYNVILLGGAALFSLAGASLLPLAVGVTLEIVWLAVGPRLEAFQRWADIQEERDGTNDERKEAGHTAEVPSAGEPAVGRRFVFERTLSEIRTLGPRDDGDFEATLAKLAPVAAGFARLIALEERLVFFLASVKEGEMEAEIESLNRDFSSETDLGARLTIRQAITLTERRLDHTRRLDGLRRTVAVKLNLVEKSVAHVRALRVALRPAGELATEIDDIVTHLAVAAALERELGES